MSMMKIITFKASIAGLLLMFTFGSIHTDVEARDFRLIRYVVSPKLKDSISKAEFEDRGLSQAAKDLNLKPISQEAVRQAVRDFFAAWNNGALSSYLDPSFVNGDRLLDAVNNVVPRDATVRVLAISSIVTRPVDEIEWLDNGNGFNRKTKVSVIVTTQIEFTNTNGLQRLDGTNEYTFNVTEEYR